MNVRRMPSAPPKSPASNTTLSRGAASPDGAASVAVQSSWANTNAAKSTSRESSTSRSRVPRPGLNVVVQGSTSATSSSPRAIASSSVACLPDDPRKMRGFTREGSVVDSMTLDPEREQRGSECHDRDRQYSQRRFRHARQCLGGNRLRPTVPVLDRARDGLRSPPHAANRRREAALSEAEVRREHRREQRREP